MRARFRIRKGPPASSHLVSPMIVAMFTPRELLARPTPGSIRYKPTGGSRPSADAVLQAASGDPKSQLLLVRRLDRVLRALSLDGRGVIETERDSARGGGTTGGYRDISERPLAKTAETDPLRRRRPRLGGTAYRGR